MFQINLDSIQRDREILQRVTNEQGDVDPQLVNVRGGIINIIQNLSIPSLTVLIQNWGGLIQDIPNNLNVLSDQVNTQIPGIRTNVQGQIVRNFQQQVEYSRLLLLQIWEQIMQNPEQTYNQYFLPGSMQLERLWSETYQIMERFIPLEEVENLWQQDQFINRPLEKEQIEAQQQAEIDEIERQPMNALIRDRVITRTRGVRFNIINTAKFRKEIQDKQQQQRPGKQIPLNEYEELFRSIFTQQEKPRKDRLRRNRQMENIIVYTFPNRYVNLKSMYTTEDYYNRYANNGANLFQDREQRLQRDRFIQLNNQYMDRIINLLRSQPDPDYNNPLDVNINRNNPIRFGFQLAIQQALGRMQQQPPNQNSVRNNVVEPFIQDIIQLFQPYVRQRWLDTNRQPATMFIQSYFFKQRGIRTRTTSIENVQNPGMDYEQQWNNKIINGNQNFMEDLLLTYAVYAGLPNPENLLNGQPFTSEIPIANIASGIPIPDGVDIDTYQRIQMIDDLIADILGLTQPGRVRFNRIHESANGDDINLLVLLRDIFDFIYQYMFVYWNNLDYHEYSSKVNTDGTHLANLLCQLHFGVNFNKPGTYIPQNNEVKQWLRDLNITDMNLHDVIFNIWIYTFIIVVLHSTDLTPVELRFAKLFFYPNQIDFVFQPNIDPDNNIQGNNFLPLLDSPFIIPRMIMRSLLYGVNDTTTLQLEGTQTPAMLYKPYYQPLPLYDRVTRPVYYTIRLDNLQMYYTFQLKSTSILLEDGEVRPDNVPELYPRLASRLNDNIVDQDNNLPEINPQLYEDWPGLTQSMNTASNIILHFLPDLRNMLENDNLVPLTVQQRRRIRMTHRLQDLLPGQDQPIPAMNSYAQLHLIFTVRANNDPARTEIGRVEPTLAQRQRAHHTLNPPTSRFRLKELDIKITLSHNFIQRLDQQLQEYFNVNGIAPNQTITQDITSSILTPMFIQNLYHQVNNNLGFRKTIIDEEEGSFYFNQLQLAEFDALYEYKLASCTYVMIPRSLNILHQEDIQTTFRQFQWNVEQQAKRAAFLDPEQNAVNFPGPSRWINGAVFTLDNIPFELKQLFPGNNCVIHQLYMEQINLKNSCLCSFAAVFFFVFGIPDKLIEDIGEEQILLNKINIRGYYFFREMLQIYYKPEDGFKGTKLSLIVANNDFLGYYIAKHMKNKDLCFIEPTHFDIFTIRSFAEQDHTAHHIGTISLMVSQHPSYNQTGLADQPQHYLNKHLIVPVYYHFDHIFILEEDSYAQYVKLCQQHELQQHFKKTPVITDLMDPPPNRTRFPNKPRGNQYIMVYDIETTSNIEEKMEAYMIYLAAFDLETDLNKLRQVNNFIDVNGMGDDEFEEIREWWDSKSFLISGEECIHKFIQCITDSCDKLPDNAVLSIWAYNGSKFDHVLIIPEIIEKWGDIKILGSPTDVKGLQFQYSRGITIQFCDICLAVGGGSLNDNAKAYMVPGKLAQSPPVDILQMTDWIQLEPELRLSLINYCKRDVLSATLLLIKFNDYCEDIAREFHTGKPQDVLEPKRYYNALYIANTLSQTAFKIVHKHMRNQPVYYLDDMNIYRAMRDSYRGGICQLMSTHRHVMNDQYHIHYLDINSLYPSVMAKYQYGVLYRTIKYKRQYLSLDTVNEFALYAISEFKLAPMFKYGYFPVESPGSGRIFYPLAWDVFNAARIYDQLFKYLWVWGFEIKKMFELNKATELQQSIVKIDMFIECEETNKDVSMFNDMHKLYHKRVTETDNSRRQTIKRIMNMAYGKYGQRDHVIKHYIYSNKFHNITQNNQSYIDDLGRQINKKWYPTRDLKITNAYPVRGNENIFCLKFEDQYEDIDHIPKISKLVHIASQITARARTRMWDIVYTCTTKLYHNRLLYMDTDSFIWYCLKESVPSMLYIHGIGQGLGQTKRVEVALEWFQAIAPKMYCYQAHDPSETGIPTELLTVFKVKGFDQRQHDMEYVRELFKMVSVSGKGTYTQVQWLRLPGSITRRQLEKEICVFNKRKMCNCYTQEYEHEQPYDNEKEIYEAETEYHLLAHKQTIKKVQQLRAFQISKQDLIEQEELITEHVKAWKMKEEVAGFQTAKQVHDINGWSESSINRYGNQSLLDEYKQIQRIMKRRLKSQFLQHRDNYAYNYLGSRKPYIYKLLRLYMVIHENCNSNEWEALDYWLMVIERIKTIENQAMVYTLSGSHKYSLKQAIQFTLAKLKQLELITEERCFTRAEEFITNELNTQKQFYNPTFYNRW